MPFRLDEFRAKMQFTTGAWMPHMVYTACVKTGVVSNTRYVQEAVCEKLARDLDLDLKGLLDRLPDCRRQVIDPAERTNARPGNMNALGTPVNRDPSGGRVMVGPANTIEEVR